ncbi:MAG: hypothetical protein ACLQBK_02555 [Candidatus Sulfotelmatobacter sp.]
MQLPPLKDLPFSGAYKMLGNICVPIMGAMALTAVAVEFWHGRVDSLASAALTSGIAVIGVSYYTFRRAISRLGVTVGEKPLSRLLVAALMMAVFGYLTCINALIRWPHH